MLYSAHAALASIHRMAIGLVCHIVVPSLPGSRVTPHSARAIYADKRAMCSIFLQRCPRLHPDECGC